MEIILPEYVKYIIDELEKEGYEAFVVGGSIRDILLGKEPNDYDVCTNALPDEIEKIFSDRKTVLIGKKFGTITVVMDDEDVEITTFRAEGEYFDGRKPKWIRFLSSIEEDLARRDFTINAIAYNENIGLVDPFGGIYDLNNGIIRCVGDPEKRFSEDYLRILRAVRFSCQLDFDMDEETYLAGKKYIKYIDKVSMERIRNEFFKIITSSYPSKGIMLMESMGILNIIIPELIPTIGYDQRNPHHNKDLFEHILCVVENTPSILEVRLAALFHDIGKTSTLSIDEEGIGHFYGHDKVGASMAREILKRFNCSNVLIEKVTILIKEHMTQHGKFSDKGLKRLIKRVGEDNIFNLFVLQKADRGCSVKDSTLDNILDMEQRTNNILNGDEPYEVKHLAIDGNDLLRMGFDRGRIIGEILDYLLNKVMENPSLNKKDILERIVLDKYSDVLKK